MAVCHFCFSRTMKIWQELFVYSRELAFARRGSLRRKNPNVFAHGTPRCSSSPCCLCFCNMFCLCLLLVDNEDLARISGTACVCFCRGSAWLAAAQGWLCYLFVWRCLVNPKVFFWNSRWLSYRVTTVKACFWTFAIAAWTNGCATCCLALPCEP